MYENEAAKVRLGIAFLEEKLNEIRDDNREAPKPAAPASDSKPRKKRERLTGKGISMICVLIILFSFYHLSYRGI